MKYVILKQKQSGWLLPIIFAEELVHSQMVPKGHMKEVNSAGFFDMKDGKVVVRPDKSESLAIGPQDGDDLILQLFIGKGLSGLNLNNLLVYYQIKAGQL